ncbi:MAG: DUF6125 family protein [Bacteroidota bacterium]
MEDEAKYALNVKQVMDFMHRIMMHHAMWFGEVYHQLGRERAMEILDTAFTNSSNIQLSRLSKVLGFEIKDGIPAPIANLPEEKLNALRDALAANWLAGDGIWFQAVESAMGMDEAKRCNDSCWAQFSPFEAWSIKRMLNLPEEAGLDGLKKALSQRLYAYVNKQSFREESDSSFVFVMNDCRVQSARKRKGMDDYPCKSAGIVEYREFARAIDSRITTQCICCPPDKHDESHYCAWKFTIG